MSSESSFLNVLLLLFLNIFFSFEISEQGMYLTLTFRQDRVAHIGSAHIDRERHDPWRKTSARRENEECSSVQSNHGCRISDHGRHARQKRETISTDRCVLELRSEKIWTKTSFLFPTWLYLIRVLWNNGTRREQSLRWVRVSLKRINNELFSRDVNEWRWNETGSIGRRYSQRTLTGGRFLQCHRDSFARWLTSYCQWQKKCLLHPRTRLIRNGSDALIHLSLSLCIRWEEFLCSILSGNLITRRINLEVRRRISWRWARERESHYHFSRILKSIGSFADLLRG